MTYYSQIGQDAYFIENIAKGKRGGRFLDVGAHDGINTSNTYALEKDYGWTGICVEANADLAEQCRINRPQSTVVHTAVWSDARNVVFQLPHSGNDFLSRVAGIPCNDNYFAQDFRETIDITMPALPLKTIIGEGDHYFDYFSLDIEGAELEALKGIDWSKTSFGFVAMEYGHRQDFAQELIQFMDSKGYVLHRVNDFDLDFEPKQ
jgi:FkbM family methyltransferase